MPQAARWARPSVTALRPADCSTSPCSDGLPKPTASVEHATASSSQSLTFARQRYSVAPFSEHVSGMVAPLSGIEVCPAAANYGSCPTTLSCLVLADLDGDGDLDLVSEMRELDMNNNPSGSMIKIHLNNGVGVFSEHATSGLNTANSADRVQKNSPITTRDSWSATTT
jgi:hypothetical protein